jgi:hypothetical protein
LESGRVGVKLSISKEWIERMAKAEDEYGDVSVVGGASDPTPMPVDYKALLTKYMALVLLNEGTTFVTTAEWMLAMSEADRKELEAIEIEAERLLR